MLRDEGGRLADEDSSVYIGAAPAKDYDFDFDDSPAPAPLPSGATPTGLRGDIPAKPAIVVGVAQAQRRAKKPGGPPPPPKRDLPPPLPGDAPLHLDSPMPIPNPSAGKSNKSMRRPVPPPFGDEPTRQVDDDILNALRALPGGSDGPSNAPPKAVFGEEPTRLANIDPRAYDETGVEERTDRARNSPAPKFNKPPSDNPFLDENGDEATRMASLDGIAAMERARNAPQHGSDERTRAVNIRNDPSISDIDWDID
jgi:hypothetical protein